MKYYEVNVKCGHVGRTKFIVKTIYVKADNRKEAAQIARQSGRVKHHHSDAIRSLKEITREEYLLGLEKMKADGYFTSTCIQDQRRYCPDIYLEIHNEELVEKYKRTRLRSRLVQQRIDKEWKKEKYKGLY